MAIKQQNQEEPEAWQRSQIIKYSIST